MYVVSGLEPVSLLLTFGVKAVSAKGALPLPTRGTEDILVEGDNGHEFGVQNYSLFKGMGLGVRIGVGSILNCLESKECTSQNMTGCHSCSYTQRQPGEGLEKQKKTDNPLHCSAGN